MIVDGCCLQSAVKVGIVRKGHAEEVSHQSQFGDRLFHPWDALGADRTTPKFQVLFVCLKQMTGELLQLLLKLAGRRDDGSCHHDGVTTASGTEPVKAGIGVCVADHDVRRIDGKLLRQYLRHNGFGAVSPERRIELRKNFA